MERVPTASRRETRLVLAVSTGLVVLVPATLFLVADTGTAAALLTGAAVLVAVVSLVVAHGAVTATHRTGLAAAAEATRARLDGTAPVVTLRLCEVVCCREDGGDVRLEAALEFVNHGPLPALVRTGTPSLGHVRERGPLGLPPGGTAPVRLTHRVPATEVEAGLRATAEHRHGWPVTVPATAENLHGTVVDQVRLDFRVQPFLRTARGSWAWTDAAAESDGGYARLVRRDYRPGPVS